ncbi:hypothetical protein L596_022797 [Steinernema carpocapsae]|uniref:Uncharacterized protein n=1 Tax=Steinernema carpocapsae TaxID=34508 RepID=A0A4U5MPD1_STECR|nr:hypothetical protein L596_022797 [Steinernema carpocapsae]
MSVETVIPSVEQASALCWMKDARNLEKRRHRNCAMKSHCPFALESSRRRAEDPRGRETEADRAEVAATSRVGRAGKKR